MLSLPLWLGRKNSNATPRWTTPSRYFATMATKAPPPTPYSARWASVGKACTTPRRQAAALSRGAAALCRMRRRPDCGAECTILPFEGGRSGAAGDGGRTSNSSLGCCYGIGARKSRMLAPDFFAYGALGREAMVRPVVEVMV